jgi:hypothetical protein
MTLPKITPTIRKLLLDPDYYRAMQMLLGATEELRMIAARNAPPRVMRTERP